MRQTVFIFLSFFAIQAVTGLVVLSLSPSPDALLAMQGGIGLFSSLLTLLALRLLNGTYGILTERNDAPYCRWSARVSLAAVGVSLPVIAFTNFFTQLLDAPDNLSATFQAMVRQPASLLLFVLAGPLVEELVFRRAMMDALLRKNCSPLVVLVVPAALFGLIHFNPAQTIGAGLLGLFLGWLYLRTRSIFPSLAVHVFNNLLGVVTLRFFPQADTWLSGAVVWLPVAGLLAALLIYAFHRWFPATPSASYPARFRRCPQCGSPRFTEASFKSKHCDRCGFTYYFNTAAATVAVILNEHDELLTCVRACEPAKGTLDLPGGFVDEGEGIEDGLLRELREELDVEATIERFLFSLPNTYVYRSFCTTTADSFFLCRLPKDAVLRAQDDVAEVRWIPLLQLSPDAFGLSSIRAGIERIQQEATAYTGSL